MKNGYQYRTKNYQARTNHFDNRDPRKQNFDNLDIIHEFTSIQVINRYRKIGEEIMGRLNG